MRKGDRSAFGEFMGQEAERVGRVLTTPEIETWFDTFPRVTLEEFKAAWAVHQEERGGMFPTPDEILRCAKRGPQVRASDGRCCEEVGSERCAYPGAINAGYGWQCRTHFRMRASGYTEPASLQVIQASREYAAPSSETEAVERGAEQRALEARRWIERNAHVYAKLKAPPPDVVIPKVADTSDRAAVDAHIAQADHERMDEINRLLAAAADAGEA